MDIRARGDGIAGTGERQVLRQYVAENPLRLADEGDELLDVQVQLPPVQGQVSLPGDESYFSVVALFDTDGCAMAINNCAPSSLARRKIALGECNLCALA
jgi:hypothetical protein